MPYENKTVIVGPSEDRIEVFYKVELRRPLRYPENATTKDRVKIQEQTTADLKKTIRETVKKELSLQEVK